MDTSHVAPFFYTNLEGFDVAALACMESNCVPVLAYLCFEIDVL